jgi:hypothetical protein
VVLVGFVVNVGFICVLLATGFKTGTSLFPKGLSKPPSKIDLNVAPNIAPRVPMQYRSQNRS